MLVWKVMATIGLALALGIGIALAQEQLPIKPSQEVRLVCSNCHGLYGRSVSPTFPNLAGQRAAERADDRTMRR